jgi:hypothetical protein
VLTGTLEMAMLEKMCPPTWNAAIGRVVLMMAVEGCRMVTIPIIGWDSRRQHPETNPN